MFFFFSTGATSLTLSLPLFKMNRRSLAYSVFYVYSIFILRLWSPIISNALSVHFVDFSTRFLAKCLHNAIQSMHYIACDVQHEPFDDCRRRLHHLRRRECDSFWSKCACIWFATFRRRIITAKFCVNLISIFFVAAAAAFGIHFLRHWSRLITKYANTRWK